RVAHRDVRLLQFDERMIAANELLVRAPVVLQKIHAPGSVGRGVLRFVLPAAGEVFARFRSRRRIDAQLQAARMYGNFSLGRIFPSAPRFPDQASSMTMY